ncbi:MAG: response regulator [Alphaproteobacteria bacterium]
MPSKVLKNKRFLVIDDEPATVEIVKEVLNQNGAKATGVTNPQNGFGMMAKETFDAVILDRYMPPVDGHEVLQQLKGNAQTKDIPVVMLTGESKESEIKKSISLGAAGYIVKPFTPKSFLKQLEIILAPKD